MSSSSTRAQYFISGIVICVLGAICFSTKAIFVKVAYRDTTVDAIALLALRMIFSLPFFVISAIRASSKQNNTRFSGKQWLFIAVVGCLGYYISSLLDFLGLQYVTAGMERLILFIYPTLVLLMVSILYKEKIQKKQWLAVGVTYAGLLIAFVAEADFKQEAGNNFALGAILIFACAITFATYIVGSGRIIPAVGAAKFNSYAMSFACTAVVIHFWVVSGKSLLHYETPVYIYSLCMAVFSTVIPSYLVSEGIKRIGSDNAAIAGSVGPISTILQAYIFLGEQISFLQILGTCFVLGGVLLIGKKSA
jgi:drug/metabolite transporter (DMT)-like permease